MLDLPLPPKKEQERNRQISRTGEKHKNEKIKNIKADRIGGLRSSRPTKLVLTEIFQAQAGG